VLAICYFRLVRVRGKMKFKPLTVADYVGLKRFFSRQKYDFCVYSLSSIVVWSNEIHQPHYALDGDILVICAEFPERPQERHLILPICPDKTFSPEVLKDLALQTGFEKYRFVPDQYLQMYGEKRVARSFAIREQTEFADYVYLKEDLAQLKGNKYAKKRNLIHQFERDYATRIKMEKIVPALIPACIAFLDAWCAERNCEREVDEELFCERIAAINALENMDEIDMKGLLVRVDDVVSAFGIASKVTHQMGALHFEKAFSKIKGLYQYFDNLCARYLFEDFKYINKESDMNIPGLARTKRSYHPVKMVRSYELRLR